MAGISALWAILLVAVVMLTVATISTVFAPSIGDILGPLGVLRG